MQADCSERRMMLQLVGTLEPSALPVHANAPCPLTTYKGVVQAEPAVSGRRGAAGQGWGLGEGRSRRGTLPISATAAKGWMAGQGMRAATQARVHVHVQLCMRMHEHAATKLTWS